MKAIMKVAPGEGHIELRDIPEPHPGPGQVKIRVQAAGLCGTDLHIYKDEFPVRPPVALGHEVAGEIADAGDDVERLAPGLRVTTETYFATCEACRYCRAGRANLCLDRRSIGSGVNGGFARYVIVPAANVRALPENVDFHAGALTEPLACVVHGVSTVPTVFPGDVAVVAGPGAIGLLALQVVKAAGAVVVVLGADGDERRLELARSLGADHVVNVQRENPRERVAALAPEGMGADVAYECSGAGAAAAGLLELVRRGGRYVQIGLFGKPIAWDLDQVCYKELVVTGSNASVPSAWMRALQLLRTGQVRAKPLITDIFGLAKWKEAFEGFERRRGVKTLFVPSD